MTRLILFCFTLLLSYVFAKECGTRPSPPQNRIINGEDTYVNEFPWQVLFYQFERAICGGSIISDYYIITAAHCVKPRNDDVQIRPEDFSAVVGAYKQSEENVDQKNMTIEKIIVHPFWNRELVINDIALLKLKEPIGLETSPLNAICLAPPTDDLEGVSAIASGWGSTDKYFGLTPDVLQKANMIIIGTSNCSSIYDKPISEKQICAGFTEKVVYSGDSGGPLQYEKDGKFYLAGITSWGHRFNPVNYPSVFTRVSSYVKFIENNTDVTL